MEIAEIIGVKRNTIYRWLRFGNTSLPKRGPRLGRRKLTVDQEEALLAKIKSTPAVAQAGLVRHIRELYGITASVATIMRVLKRAGITYKKAINKNSEYDIERGLRP